MCLGNRCLPTQFECFRFVLVPRQDGVLIVEHMDLWTGPSSADDQDTGLEKVGQTLAPIMIRRRKSEVLRQLPSRTA